MIGYIVASGGDRCAASLTQTKITSNGEIHSGGTEIFPEDSTQENGVIFILCKRKNLIHFSTCRVKPAVVAERIATRWNSNWRNTCDLYLFLLMALLLRYN
jgi:hypothetical protein